MNHSTLVRRMSEAGAPPEAIAIALEALEAVEEKDLERKAKRAEAKRRERHVARQSHDSSATVAPTPPLPLVPSPSSSPDPSSFPSPIIPSPPHSARSKKVSSKRTPLEEDDWPDDRENEIATKAGMSAITIELEWEKFRAHHMAKGSLMANWTQAWVTWVTNWKAFGAKQAGRNNGYGFEKNGKENWRTH